jgi:putative membrane protein
VKSLYRNSTRGEQSSAGAAHRIAVDRSILTTDDERSGDYTYRNQDDPMPDVITRDRLALLLLAASLAGLFVWSVIAPLDYTTWALEAAPVVIATIILAATRRRFPLTTLAYFAIGLHAAILLIGAHYTYAEVPLFNDLRDALGLSRNHYDRVGHFAQGFFPAIVAREILLRRSPLRPGKWLFFIVTCICVAISAVYEMIEWLTAMLAGEAAAAFLGTQGDVWDTQWDMFLALAGTLAAQILISSAHDRALRRIPR